LTAVVQVEAGQVPLLARPYFADGDPGPIVGVLAQVPELLVVALPFIGAALGPSSISARDKEIVIVRTSALAGCRFCVQSHAVVALDVGLTAPQVASLQAAGPIVEGFDAPRDLALIRWVDVVANGGPVADSERAAVLSHWCNHEVIELTTVIGATLMLNRFATSLDLPTSAEVLTRLGREGLL